MKSAIRKMMNDGSSYEESVPLAAEKHHCSEGTAKRAYETIKKLLDDVYKNSSPVTEEDWEQLRELGKSHPP